MDNIILAGLSILLYGIVTIWQGLYFARKTHFPRLAWWLLGWGAVSVHAILLYHWIDIGPGQNLSFFNLFSLVIWLVAVLMLIAALTKPVANLSIFVFPLACLSIILAVLFPRFEVVHTATNPKELLHILLSTVAFSILCLTALQALLLMMQERLLKTKQAGGVIRILPPLEVMESLLFQMLFLGFVFLTLVLLTSIWSFYKVFTVTIWQKSLLSLFAWLVFATLLVGRRYLGWRGPQVIRWTLGGVFLVMVAYFGSEYLAILET